AVREEGMKLYGYWRSSCTYRVRIALGLKGLAYETHAVDLRAGRQHDDAFTAVNPTAQVPVIELPEGGWLSQSIAILEYLEEAHPEPALLPRERAARARTRQLTEI